VLVAAAPSWFADNVGLIFVALLLVGAIVVFRVVKETVTKVMLLALIVGAAVFVYVNRSPLKACAESCECEIADQEVSVPFCDPNFELAAAVMPAARPA
jgi:hypothetical protein